MPDRRPAPKRFVGGTRNLLDVSVELDGSAARVAARGEIDLTTSPWLDTALGMLASDDAVRRIVVDLQGVRFIDSSGLHALARRATAAQRDGFELAVVGVRDHIRRVFVLTGLDRVVPLAAE